MGRGSYTAGTAGLTTNVLTSLISALSGSSATSSLVKGSSGNIQTALGGSIPFANIADPGKAGTASTSAPQAFLTIMFFDERFNYVSTSSQWVQVSQSGDGASPLVLPNIQAPKNGYAYVYISNKGAQPVYFDNMQVGLTHGPIMEEDHYYAYGLKIAAISSTIIASSQEGYVTNKNLYNDKELEDDGGLNWYDYGYRSYDAQIGRFPQLDPLTHSYPELTPFQYASDEPVANIDEDGLEALNVSMPAENAFQTGAKVTFGGGLATGSLIRSAAVAGASVGTDVVEHAFANGVINKAFAVRSLISTVGAACLTVICVFIPLEAGNRRPEVIPPGYRWGGDCLLPIRKYDIKDIPKEKPLPEPDKPGKPPGDDDDDDDKVFYVTYTKSKIMPDGSVKTYSGRTSGIYEGDGPTDAEADAAIAVREAGHKILNKERYSRAQRDRYSTDYASIRGREQQLIDFYGGAQRDRGGTSRNKIRGVGKSNPRRQMYDDAATARYGKLPSNHPADINP